MQATVRLQCRFEPNDALRHHLRKILLLTALTLPKGSQEPLPRDAFNYIAGLLDMFDIWQWPDGTPLLHHAGTPDNPKAKLLGSKLDDLSEAIRRDFQIQALTLFTLFEQDAEGELIELAAERLSKIVGGSRAFMEPVTRIKVIWKGKLSYLGEEDQV
ncbi:hypothetical protein P7C70_g4810, partial [Phenoliferia sp. Uapishka_3]